MSRPDGRAVTIDEVGEPARPHGGTGACYAAVVPCTFTPRSGEKALTIGHDDCANRTRVLEDFDRVTGRIQEFYGLTSVDTLPVVVPVGAGSDAHQDSLASPRAAGDDTFIRGPCHVQDSRPIHPAL